MNILFFIDSSHSVLMKTKNKCVLYKYSDYKYTIYYEISQP